MRSKFGHSICRQVYPTCWAQGNPFLPVVTPHRLATWQDIYTDLDLSEICRGIWDSYGENDGERCQMRQSRCIIFPLRLKQINQRKIISISNTISLSLFADHKTSNLPFFLPSAVCIHMIYLQKLKCWPLLWFPSTFRGGPVPTDTELTPFQSYIFKVVPAPSFFKKNILRKKKKGSTGVTLPQQVSKTLYFEAFC